MDFMNLHQAAHGDREFGFIETRLRVARKTVVGHWQDPYVADRIGAWARAACAWREAHHLKVARFGDNMRQVADTEGDKVEAQIRLGVAVNGYGVSDLGRRRPGGARRPRSTRLARGLRRRVRRGARARAAAAPGATSCARPPGSRSACATFLTAGGFGAFTDTFEDLDGLRQLPGIAVQRLMADGYGFGAEGDWKSAVLVRLLKVMATGLPGGTSFMEDYTYDLDPAGPTVLGAHMLEVCPSIAAGRPRCEIHPLSIGGRADPVRLVFDAAPGPGDRGRPDRPRRPVPDRRQRDRHRRRPSSALPRLPVARAVWQPRPDMRTAVEAWLSAGGAHHTVLSRALDPEPLTDFAEMAGDRAPAHRRDDHGSPAFRQELRWNQAYHHLARGL